MVKSKVSLSAEKWRSLISVWGPILAAALLTVRNVVNAAWTSSGWAPVIALLLAGLVFQRLDLIQQQQKDQDEKLNKLVESTCTVTRYSNGKEFYGALKAAVKEANDDVRASYFRRVPPTYEKAANEYFKTCISWVNAKSDRQLLRVMVEPNTKAMRDWVDEQRDLAKSIRKGAYRLKTIQLHDTRAMSEVDALSIAVIDEKTVFCAFTTDDETVRGYSLTSHELGSYYTLYHQRLFNSGREIF